MAHTITTAPAGNTFDVNKDETILHAALDAGVNLPYGCGNGFCGACKARIASGDTHYEKGFEPSPLSEEEIEQGMVLCCQAIPDSDLKLEVAEVEVDAIKVENYNTKVTEITQMTDDVIKLVLNMGESNHMQYFAGQYVEFLVENGKSRAFSIANYSDNQSTLEFHIKHNPDGTFTDPLFNAEYNHKDMIQIKGPLGSFFIREDSDRPIIMIAGGTGFAPIKAMIEHLIATKSNRTIKLYWGVQTKADLYMDDLAKAWVKAYATISYTPVLSNPEANWTGATGYVTDIVAEQNPGMAGYEIYMTGPPPMINAGAKAFKSLGMPQERMYSDSFEAGE